MRLGERWTRGAPAALHLAFLALARAPARTVATAGFLIVSIGLALFAASYRATLDDGARDEAAFAVPLDFTLTEGTQLVLPLDAAPLAATTRSRRASRAYPVLRQTATSPGPERRCSHRPSSASRRRRSRSSTGARTSRASRRDAISRRLGADGPAALRGVPLPPGTRDARA